VSFFKLSIFNNSLQRSIKNLHIKKYIQSIPYGESVLDYGSGFSPYKKIFQIKYSQYYTAEFKATSDIIYKNLSDYIINEDETINCESELFDCVLLTEVLEHVYEPGKVLKEIYRILKKGGILIGTVPFLKDEHDTPFDFYRYTYFALAKMLKDNKFEIKYLDYIGDSIGSLISLITYHTKGLVLLLTKIKLRYIAIILELFIFRIPEYIYYFFCKIGIRLNKIKYFRNLPLGYSFLVYKNE
jgi:SAM-dependent methyltransferase